MKEWMHLLWLKSSSSQLSTEHCVFAPIFDISEIKITFKISSITKKIKNGKYLHQKIHWTIVVGGRLRQIFSSKNLFPSRSVPTRVPCFCMTFPPKSPQPSTLLTPPTVSNADRPYVKSLWGRTCLGAVTQNSSLIDKGRQQQYAG